MRNNRSWLKPATAAAGALALGMSMAACSSGGDSAANNRPENEIHVLVYGDAANDV
ncbi:hypothetical protein [Arthrobacter gandavensis]|uniref:hypothetical protein n=1 Tax=Arthrobacter gandavensis TaxID=169960 RepID=UPI001E3E1306|nr:hypothetical protein [Arthrobacter gandavensis]